MLTATVSLPDVYLPFSSPEPVVSWSRGRVGYKLSRVALGTRMSIYLLLVRKAKEGRKEKTGFGFPSTYCSSSERNPLVVLVSK